MKITKTQLKQIIKEEIAALSEGLKPDKVHVFKRLKSGKWGKSILARRRKTTRRTYKSTSEQTRFPL